MINFLSATLRLQKIKYGFMKNTKCLLPFHFSKSLIACFLLITQVCFGQDCQTQAANKPSTYDPNFQSFLNPVGKPASWDISKMKPHLAKVESWMRNTLKGFTGAKLMYGNYYFLDPTGIDFFYKLSGLKGSYEGIMMFFAYYCYENKTKIETEGESGSNIKVDINYIFNSDLCSNMNVFTINGKSAFTVLEKNSANGRIDYYDLRKRMTYDDTLYTSKADMFVIRNSDKPVFIPVTRKEYLQQLLKNAEDYKNSEIASAKRDYTPAAEAANKASFDDQLKRIDNSKTSTPEQMAPYRKRFIETWETEKQKFEKRMTRAETEVTKSKEVLQEYLNKPQEWLGRSFKSFYSDSYTAKGLKSYLDRLDIYNESKEDYTRSEVVSVNPAYFNKALGMDVPQVMLLTLAKGSYRYMHKLANLVKQPAALAPLEAILNPGKSTTPATVPPAITSTYKLSYLPKLNTLTPLIVPAGMKPSIASTIPVNNSPVAKLNFEIPLFSPKLKPLPAQPFTSEAYKNYVQELYTNISNAIKPEIKKKADGYLANKKITKSKDIGNTALAAWLQNTPEASLYLYSKAVVNDPSDALTANNFSAFLMMGGLPEKSIPILEYWNKQKPGKSTLLANLGNAYYRLGDVNNTMKYLLQCVQKDSLHPTANKLLCIMYLKKGDVKKAEEHATKSITKSHDEEVITILRQLNSKIKVGEVMSRFPPLPAKEFPMLKRSQLPAMPSQLDNMEQFIVELNAIRQSVNMTIDAISAKYPKANDDNQQQILIQAIKNGISPMMIKAQYIIMDGMQVYQEEKIKEDDIFKYNLKALNVPHNTNMKAIQTKYNSLMDKLEGGEAGDEDKLQALEKEKCLELNTKTQAYLTRLSNLANQHAQRQEYISRKFYRDYANWAPYWEPQSKSSFPTIERDYLKDISGILSEYTLVSKMNCTAYEPLAEKKGIMQQWEDEYCADFKGKIKAGAGAVAWTCNSWGIEGGEGIVGALEVNYSNEGDFEDFTFELGLGAEWKVGTEDIAEVGAGASVKEFVKIGPGSPSGKWEVKDAGVKGEVSIEGEIGIVSGEAKVIEVSAGYKSGVEKKGMLIQFLNSN